MNKKLLYAKNEYNHKVKTEGWRNREMSRPFDADIGNTEQFQSHYKRFGNNETQWISTTDASLKDALSKRNKKFEDNPEKLIYNVHTFIR